MINALIGISMAIGFVLIAPWVVALFMWVFEYYESYLGWVADILDI